MEKIFVLIIAGIAMLLIGCLFPKTEPLEPLPTYTPHPIPEAKIVIVTPTPVPDEGWTCFTGKIELSNRGVGVAVIGEQVICAKEWKISNLYGPVGNLESNPDHPLTFKDLNKFIEQNLE